MGILRENLEKIKGKNTFLNDNFGGDWKNYFFVILIIFLVSVGSFGLGRLSVTYQGEDGSKNEPLIPLEESVFSEFSGGEYVASRTGRKYHLPWCAGAQAIKEGNKIFFQTKEEAEKAGYLPAANCKGI